MSHLTAEQLDAWNDGVRNGGDDLTAHMKQCEQCQNSARAMHEVHQAVMVWAEDVAPNVNDDFADKIMQRVAAESPAVVTVSPQSASRAARKASWLWGAAPIALAAAAALVLVIRGPNHGHGRGSAIEEEWHPDPGKRLTALRKSATGRVPHGAEVISVDPSDDRSTYAILEVPGSGDGITTAVVWIEDAPVDQSGAVE